MDAIRKIETALAAGPTEGPWKTDAYGTVKVGRYSLCTPGAGESLSLMAASNKAKTNAAFIAACNPANTRELLQTLASKEAEIARLRSALNAMLTHMGMDEDEWNKPTFDQARSALRGVS